ncbi:MAG: FliH/SctL family protein [Rubrivivax sp.]
MTSSSKPAGYRNVPPPSGAGAGGARGPSPYSRFIPREELGSFAAWNPGSLNGEPAPGTPGQGAQASPPPPADSAAVQAQVAAARQSGYQDGYRDGLVALESFKQSFATQMAAQVGQLVHGFGAQIDALEQQMAQAVAQASVMLARRVVRAELHSHPEHVAESAQQAVNAVLLSARHIRVMVHPDDHALVAAGAAEALQARGARLLAQADIERGGCLIESDLGQIDARIEQRWRQAAAVLGSELPWSDDGEDSSP